MAFITAETRSSIIELAMGMLNQAPSTTLLSTLIEKSTSGSSMQDLADYIATTDAFTAEYPATQTAREFATEMFGKLITGGTLDADINTAVIDLLEGLLTGGTTKAQGFVAVIDFLANPANAAHADLGDIAQSFQNRADAAEYFVVTKELGGSTDAELAAAIASVTSDADTLTAANEAADATASAEEVVAGQTFTLTTGLDTLVGASTNDTFSAQDNAGATTNTLTTGDTLTGGAGTDTLLISASGTPVGGVTNGVATSGIEAVSVYNNSTAAYEVDAALMSGLSDVYINGGVNSTIVDDVDTLANLHLLSTNVAAELSTTAAAVTGSADEVVILSNSSALTANVTATYDGVEVINFMAAGTTGAYSIAGEFTGTNRTLTLDSDALEKVVVTGDANASIAVSLVGAALETQTSELDASAAGGSITAEVTKGASATAAVTMSAQADHLDYNGALASTITLDGGDGIDTLELDTDLAYSKTATAQAGAGVSNFEALYLASGTDIDERALTNNAGITSVVAVAAASYEEATALASVTQLSTGAFTTTLATDGTEDALAVTLAGAGVTSTLSAANVEALTLASGGTAANTVTMTAAGSADLTSVTAVGTAGLSLTVSGTSLATVDASGVTGVGSAFTLVASASEADMTVTASANRPTVSATGTANTITTGEGDDTVTGGAYKDVIVTNNGADTVNSGDGDDDITTGKGDDTITVGDGDTTISAGNNDDTVTAGDGDNTITLGSGDDTVTAGDGDNTITLGAGDDTATTGAGDDIVIMSDYDDDDVLSLGAGTNVLLASALATTGAYPVAGNFVAMTADTAPQFTDVDVAYIGHTAAAANISAATAETIDFTDSSGFGTMSLNFVTAAATTNYTVTNFDGSVANLSALAVDAPAVLNLDGTGQDALTVVTHNYTGTTPAIVVTQVDALTIDTLETLTVSGTEAAVADTVLGAITADGSDSVTIKTDAVTSTITTVDFTTGAVSADAATALAVTAGGNTNLIVGAVSNTGTDLETLSVTAGDDANLNLTSVTATGSDLSTLTVTAGVGATIGADLTGTTVLPITADTIEAAAITLGAASVSALNLLYGGTTTITATTGSTLLLGTVGVASTASSTTITGRGDLNNGTITLLGDGTFNFSGFVQAAGSITIDANNDGDDKTIVTNNQAATTTNLLVNGAGDNTITTGAADDAITTGAGDDTVNGGAGQDTIITAAGDDAINGGAAADIVTPGTGADTVTATSGDRIIFAAGDSQTGAAIVSGTTALSTADVITAPTADGETLLIDLVAMGNTLADVAAGAITFGTTVMAGVTANEILILEGTLDSDDIFTAAADGTTGNTHTLIQIDTNGTTAGGVENILIVGVFDDTLSSITTEVLTLVV